MYLLYLFALQLLASVSMAATRMQLGKEKVSMFADVAKVFIKSGKGGNGHVSFRRELYVPAGGPAVISSSRWIRG